MTTMRYAVLLVALPFACFFQSCETLAAPDGTQPEAILLAREACGLERLAAREIRRYLYLRTGRLLPIQATPAVGAGQGDLVVVASAERPLLRSLGVEAPPEVAALRPDEYLLRTLFTRQRQIILAAGGDAVGTLYAAYRLAEHLGVRFYLHGDVVPDRPMPLRIAPVNELGRPLFAVRGIQPFHDFPEGPDWWNLEDYLAIVSQLPKLRMNFLGLHTYPEGAPNAEPTVWIGPPEDIGPGSTVKASYPASYQNTLRGNWGYQAKKTGDFALGAAQLFERDDFGAEVMWGQAPQPQKPEDCNRLFARVGELLRQAFAHARQLGVQTCVGTETPLTVPRAVRERLQSGGRSVRDPAVITELYEGIFRRAAQAYAPDYYWFWTPEGWTWEGAKPAQIAATTNDLAAALTAYARVRPPFKLATCGWVLGPPQDRVLFDRVLPKNIAVSCINREVGKAPVDPAFARVTGRSKWAIPWLEDDPALTAPQLWVGRMRRDAAAARAYGCDGLLGIHWRTRVLGPAVSALAAAAWDQSAWNPASEMAVETARVAGPVGGKFATFPNRAVADTEDDPLYQSVRYNVSAYHLLAPNGHYTVTLKFCEPHYKEAGKRVFSVKLQDQPVIEHLDIFARVGRDRALDVICDHVVVTNGWLSLEFVPEVEYPSIAAFAVVGPAYTLKINCAGPAYKDFAADWPEGDAAPATVPPTDDFYLDWARAEFGETVAAEASALFARLDGRLPRPSDWVHGPGGIRPDPRPWSEVSREYGFVDELAALRPRVKGAGHRERFDWWLHTFEYLRAMGEINCTWAEITNAMGRVAAVPEAAARRTLAEQQVLPLRRQLVEQVTRMYSNLLATVSNPGELGTVANWEQHNFPDLLTKPGQQLAEWLGAPLPPDAQLASSYKGPVRIIVPTRRTSYTPDDDFVLKVIVLSEARPRAALLRWRPLGTGRFRAVPLRHVARGVYQAQFPRQATAGDDLEYYLEVTPASGGRVIFPPTAPALNQTLTAQPAGQ